MLHAGLVVLGSGDESLPSSTKLSTMVFLPKAAPLGEVATSSSEESSLRPLTLTDTLPKVLVLAVNGRLAALAERTVLANQRGLVFVHSLADNLYDLEAVRNSATKKPPRWSTLMMRNVEVVHLVLQRSNGSRHR